MLLTPDMRTVLPYLPTHTKRMLQNTHTRTLKDQNNTHTKRIQHGECTNNIFLFHRRHLSSQHEASHGFQYDRVVLIRPDVLIHNRRDLVLAKLKRGGMHCTSFGRGAGDFHFGKE
jgi:hypothetical protein